MTNTYTFPKGSWAEWVVTLKFLHKTNSVISLITSSHDGGIFSTSVLNSLSCFHFFPFLGARFGLVVLLSEGETAPSSLVDGIEGGAVLSL